ncbi:MAG: hypothetical protein DMF17_09595 [Verrucomicrobia bacterium]|nr:MAG: hypothetical protein DMF17_09595 [Verrucomicrobiota bacterium]
MGVGCWALDVERLPNFGTWKLNEAKSKIPAGMGKNTTVVYEEQKDKIKVTVDGIDKDGKPTHSVWIGKADGKAYPAKGNLPYNSVAYKVVNDRTYDLTAMKDGKMSQLRTIGRQRPEEFVRRRRSSVRKLT